MTKIESHQSEEDIDKATIKHFENLCSNIAKVCSKDRFKEIAQKVLEETLEKSADMPVSEEKEA
jgi:hypothetical protein